jgi:outer membrane protein
MKKSLIALGSLIIMISALYAAKEQKIGFVNTEYIIKNYRTASDAQRAFETELSKYKRNADSLKTAYESAQAELESQKLMLSEPAKSAKLIEIGQFKRAYDDYLASVWGTGGKIEQKNRELITPIVQKIQGVVEQIAAKDGYSLILDASESKIVYAQNGLDLTDQVLDELNKEYAPTITPPLVPEKEISYAVFPIFNENQSAQEDNIGEQVRQAIYELVKGFSNTRDISAAEINSAMLARSINITSQITDVDANSIGRTVQADYIVMGSASEQGKKITFSLKVTEPLTSKIIYSGSGESARIEEIKQSIGNLLQQAIKIIRPPANK